MFPSFSGPFSCTLHDSFFRLWYEERDEATAINESSYVSEFVAVSLRGKRNRFAPNAGLTDKVNYCRHIFVGPGGSLQEVVRLNVWDDRHRENLIAFHFSRQYAEMHYRESNEQPQFYVVSRDCPWDFEYVMHDGKHFFLEICRIADRALLKAIKAENEASFYCQRNFSLVTKF